MFLPKMFRNRDFAGLTAEQADLMSARRAGDVLMALSNQDREKRACSFDESWQRICNRHGFLYKMANREIPSSGWDEAEANAFQTFSSDLSPDGDVVKVVNEKEAESARLAFLKAYEHLRRMEPGLTPGEIWEKIRTDWPQVYWPFVSITGK
jgi:hypothetical protein